MVMPSFWKQEWYMRKSNEFVIEAADRKSWALTCITLLTVVVAFFAGRATCGHPADIIAFIVTFILFGLATFWFRVSYLCGLEVKRRGLDVQK